MVVRGANIAKNFSSLLKKEASITRLTLSYCQKRPSVTMILTVIVFPTCVFGGIPLKYRLSESNSSHPGSASPLESIASLQAIFVRICISIIIDLELKLTVCNNSLELIAKLFTNSFILQLRRRVRKTYNEVKRHRFHACIISCDIYLIILFVHVG